MRNNVGSGVRIPCKSIQLCIKLQLSSDERGSAWLSLSCVCIIRCNGSVAREKLLRRDLLPILLINIFSPWTRENESDLWSPSMLIIVSVSGKIRFVPLCRSRIIRGKMDILYLGLAIVQPWLDLNVKIWSRISLIIGSIISWNYSGINELWRSSIWYTYLHSSCSLYKKEIYKEMIFSCVERRLQFRSIKLMFKNLWMNLLIEKMILFFFF